MNSELKTARPETCSKIWDLQQDLGPAAKPGTPGATGRKLSRKVRVAVTSVKAKVQRISKFFNKRAVRLSSWNLVR